MSILETAAVVLPHVSSVPAGDLLNTATSQTDAIRTLLKSFSAVAGIAFVIVNWIKSGGAMGRVIVCGIGAAAFVWIVWNISDLKDKVGSEFAESAIVIVDPSHTTST